MNRRRMFRLMFALLGASTLVIGGVAILIYLSHKQAPVGNERESATSAVETVAQPSATQPPDGRPPAPLAGTTAPIPGLSYALFSGSHPLAAFHADPLPVFSPQDVPSIEGILTFRGNAQRTMPVFGTIESATSLSQLWQAHTSRSSWGGGAGWTGQPAIVRWPDRTRAMMNLYEEFKNRPNFTEVIYASLDGRIYFLDLATGKPSRPPILIRNPIKGSVTLDPRGYPLLYVGQGIPETGAIGYRIFSLIDQSLLYFLDGKDPIAGRKWGAFDGAPLIHGDTDTMILGGENGLIYNIKLNTTFNRTTPSITIKPTVTKYRYKAAGQKEIGTENSLSAYKNYVYFADNSGVIQCLDITTMKPVWMTPGPDDTDATLTVEEENGRPVLYTGCEVDKQGTAGTALIRKLDGLTGKVLWEKAYPCFSLKGSRPVNGGVLATNIVGKQKAADRVVFTIARYHTFNGGLIVALDKTDGHEIWQQITTAYAWSSPVDLYDANGNMYILQGDSAGMLRLLDGKNGVERTRLSLNANIEATPAVFNGTAVVATREPYIYGIQIH
ncbi:hypothetical protein DFP93_101142 [Aneurinibacillus soli]|uniref:Outer membrane biogenesis protein BamB n=1 Tax=Aneurinibacillus soli TaxID=1500254 RepID=A0A0U5B0F3_9BACL|nr:PQQ-binding-like beta-propeller repeat protein [Aneurinibacillus soli]PYE64117.1 hypothetical protein DFP93_101142 [Aneurinibacillus soli]BAU28066.1 outer membrane biogenesis protein BamB [Aneurinibacillus soli]